MSGSSLFYRAYGLNFRSAFALPWRPESPSGREADVTIRYGAVPAALPAPAGASRPDPVPFWQTAPGAFLQQVDGVARYLVRDGREILIEPADDGGDGVPSYLLGSVLAALLHQRGILGLHASAVATEAGAVLFAGCSGAGKSTLLAALMQRGYAMLADDLTGVVLADGDRPMALSAFPCLRLWADAVDALGWWPRTRGKVQEALDKYVTPADRFRAAPLAVRAVYMLTLENRDDVELRALSPAAAFEWLWQYTYRKRFLHGLGQQPAHFRSASALARQAPVTLAARPAHPFRLDALADRIEQDLDDRR